VKKKRIVLSIAAVWFILAVWVAVAAADGVDRSLRRKSETMRKTALVIGNSSYTTKPLKNPENDARDMAATLRDLGFTVRLKLNADKRGMEDAIRSFGKDAQQQPMQSAPPPAIRPGYSVNADEERWLAVTAKLKIRQIGASAVQPGLTAAPKQGDTYKDPTTGMEFIFVKGGCYQMGNTFDGGGSDEKPVHEVCVDDFWIGKYEVTQGEYIKIMGSNPSYFKKGDSYPVETVSWNDAEEFISLLNRKTEKGYRLPTEAEWEYAARSGGKREKYAGGGGVDALAWHDSNSGDSTHRVGTKRKNGLGLYDIAGNVWEWCSDWYGRNYYSSSSRNNPLGPSSGSSRVIRSGSGGSSPEGVRSAVRNRDVPGVRSGDLGFRLVFPEAENVQGVQCIF